jgi:hypothetical protein
VALAVNYFTTATVTTSAALFTASTGQFSASTYLRDLVVTNSGTVNTLFVSYGPSASSAAAATSFAIPPGQSVLLMGQTPTANILFGFAATATTAQLGFASVVSVV